MLEGMPLDILVDILRMVLVQDFPIDTHGPIMPTLKETYQKFCRIRYRRDRLKTITPRDLALFGVSHAVRSVALPIFWGENTFRIYVRTTAGAKVSTKFLRLQQEPTVNLVRKLQIELAFGERRQVSALHEFLCSQFSSLAKIEELDNTGSLVIDARVESEWGWPQVVICEAIVDRVLEDFETRFAWRFPNLGFKNIN